MRLFLKAIAVLCVLTFSTGVFAVSSAERKIAKSKAKSEAKIAQLEVKYANDPEKLAEVTAKQELKTEAKVEQIEDRPSPN